MLNTKIIGNRITEARKKINISQAQLAEQLFISSQAVGKWERGESMPDIITLNRLGEILGVDLNYFSAHPESTSSEPVKNSEASFDQGSAQTTETVQAGKTLKWDMSRGNWVDADFSGLKNLNEKFSSSNMLRCKFIGSDLSGLLLSGNNINGCDFSESDLNGSHIKGSHLQNDQFTDCSLGDTEFSGSHVLGCDFSGTDLTGVVFKSGGFEKNTLSNAVWNRSSFNSMYLADLVFEGNIENCSFENCAFKRVTFQNATLTNTFFKNKSLKQIKFIDCQADRLTYEFLKNGKADMSGIKLVML
ncbi:MAG: transcriptional regulator [Fluviicola sp.]|jgi:uncharacterized protein YjbI with pentapeptide repeats|uniref:pentapeptide repeat-containing protein n=1 Tax=Fluviicola sp. TaxID=1917219 RepID=UPI00262A3690|nr:pentapeptide repeat-containing protein [Fluviicola sp.]MDF3026563.1 transcriptional regulator [Fluviicola sp.]